MTDSAINYTHLGIMVIIFIITYYYIIKSSFDKTMAALLGALASLIIGSILGIFDQTELLSEGLAHDYLILAIIFGNLLMVVVASEVGILQFISIKLLKITRGDPNKIFWSFGILTFVFSAFVNTIPAILIVGALTVVVCKELEYDPKNYILMEIVITNTGGLTTSISAITNLIIAIPFKIGYLRFMIISLPLALILFFVSMVAIKRLCPIPEPSDMEWRLAKIQNFDEWSFIKDKRSFYLTSAALGLSLMILLFSDAIGFEIAVIVVGGGIVMVYTSKKNIEQILAKIDWSLLAFFLSLFVLVKIVELAGLISLITDALLEVIGDNDFTSGLIILIASSFLSGILDNIVLAIALTPVLLELNQSPENSSVNIGVLVWALIIGTNLGGGLTPIGAPPSVLGLGILYRETGEKVGWIEFFRTVGLVTLIRIAISIIYIFILTLIKESYLVGI
jgi:Na+/H+ antiporter NhaD/arsenite permease-like protein